MSFKEITPDQARKNSETAAFGTEQVLAQLYQSIEANSKSGATSITSMFSMEAVSESELEAAKARLSATGYTVSTDVSGAVRVVKVSW